LRHGKISTVNSDFSSTGLAEGSESARIPMHLRYLDILRSNRDFRRLWLAQLVSEMGDWFYTLAVYDMLIQTTHSGKSVSYAIMIQTLPWFFMTPLAGHVVDRFPRRHVMIVADLVRAFVVLGLMAVRSPGQIWLVYVLLGVETVFTSLFEPARNAALPNVVEEKDVLAANALTSGTWAVALTTGAALGGIVASLLGRDFAFAINSLSYFGSAFFIQRMHLKEGHMAQAERGGHGGGLLRGVEDLRQSLGYLMENPRVIMLMFAKTGLGLMSGALLLLTLYGERIFTLQHVLPAGILRSQGPLAVGVLYAARGFGAGFGPILGDRISQGRTSRMWLMIGAGFFLMGASYLGLSVAPVLWLGFLAVMCAHMTGSNNWVMSVTLLQTNTPDALRGRVFAIDLGFVMLTIAATNYLIGVGFDTLHMTPRQLAAGLGFTLMLPGVLWFVMLYIWKRRYPLP
jgi:MFS family permease